VKRLVPDDSDARFIRRVLILLTVGAVVVALVRAADLLILTFGAVLGAVVIRAIADRFAQIGVPRRWSVAAAMASVLAAIAFLVWLFAVQFGPQVEALVRAIPQLVARLKEWAQGSPVAAKLYDAAQAAFAGSRVARDASGFALGSFELFLNALLLLVGALFMAADPGVYLRGLLLLVPKGNGRDAVADALADVGTTLRLWLRTQIILMTSMGLLVGLGLWIAGVPSPAALGLLAGLSEFIPYVGPAAAMLPALGLAATGGTGALIGCLLVFAGVGAKEADPSLADEEEDDTPLADPEDDDDRKAIRLGWIFHAIMSAKAQIGWFLSTAYRALVSSGPQPRTAAAGRQEPSLARGQKKPTLAPEMVGDEDEEEEEADEEEVEDEDTD
jgi:predicted PurR-regulated permease PerM